MRLLVVHGVDSALAGAFALVGAIGDNEKPNPDNGEDGEENEGNHQVLPGPNPLLACAVQASSVHKMPVGPVQ